MRCHYDILNLDLKAEDDEIKKAYRKLALRCHPDKNPERIEECTKEFHQLQEAYKVLSDPHERAWYDKYRTSILRGGQGVFSDYEDDTINIYPFFMSSCYEDFSDESNGFYTIYRKLFESIAEQDLQYRNKNDDNFIIPNFGDSGSTYEDTVGQFYSYWDTYITLRSYDWSDVHELKQAASRYIRRAMESENRKKRDKSKRERNLQIRALVSFVKKRDERLQIYRARLENRAFEVKHLTLDNRAKHLRERAEQLVDYKETQWSSNSIIEEDLKKLEIKISKQFDDHSAEEIGSDDENYFTDLLCIACAKVFKSEKAFINHEKSRKHKENKAIMKTEILLEDDQNDFNAELNSRLNGDDVSQEIDQTSDQKVKQSKKSKKREKQNIKQKQKLEELSKIKHEELEKLEELAISKQLRNDKDISLRSFNKNNTSVSKIKSLSSDDDEEDENDADADKMDQLKCRICTKSFKTRNLLFRHVKSTGHALHIDLTTKDLPSVNPEFGTKGRKKKNRSKKHVEYEYE